MGSEFVAATWNLALATRQLRLWRVSRAAFARVAAKGEPGWAGEAAAQIVALDRELGADAAIAKLHEQFRVLVTAGSVRNTILDPGNDMAEYQRRSRSILEDETPSSSPTCGASRHRRGASCTRASARRHPISSRASCPWPAFSTKRVARLPQRRR